MLILIYVASLGRCKRCCGHFQVFLFDLSFRSGRCNFPLGMEDGRIRDKDITASDFHVDSSAAHFARFNSHKGAGAWCHPSIAKDNENEYLQVFFVSFLIALLMGSFDIFRRFV